MGGRAALALVVLLAGGASGAHAEDAAAPSAAERTLAREEFERGVAAIKDGRWEDAYQLFRRAHALTGDPRILLNLAAAQKKTGRLVEAQESYRQLRSSAAEAGLADQLETIDRLIAELKASLGRIHLRVDGMARGDQLQLDGAPISIAVIGSRVPVDPGTRTVRVLRGEVELARRTLEVAPGEERTVHLAVRTATAAALTLPPSSVAPALEPDEDLVDGPWLWVGLGLALAAGGAVIVAVASQPEAAYAGSTGIVLRGLSW